MPGETDAGPVPRPGSKKMIGRTLAQHIEKQDTAMPRVQNAETLAGFHYVAATNPY